MLNLTRPLMRMCVVAGLAVMAIAAQAFIFDGQISIDRALNSPTLTVRYSNANASLVELRVNGESIASRAVNAGRNSGETTFTLNLASLSAGENKVEIRLFDKSGKLIASETTTVTTEATQGPVFLTNPKMGATIRGNVDIKLGFGQQMKNSYVSFFIDNQFKSISNVPPFEFTWDTTRDTNGWHEVEAWVVDGSSSTYKTRKIKVFVENPGGRTNRLVAAPTVVQPAVKSVEPTLQPPVKQPNAQPPVKKLAPMPLEGSTSNALNPRIGGTITTKPAEVQPSVSTGLKEMMPTGKRLAYKPAGVQVKTALKLPPATILHNVPSAAVGGSISIAKGQRLPNIGTFAIVLNTQFVNFDVQPRVTGGIPLTPFRHLIEKAGGKVKWAGKQKNVLAQADGRDIFLHIGDAFAQIDKIRIELETPSFIESGRTIVPLSFMRDALNVNIDYDKATGHVLITSVKK
jgi:hypothetical protein